MSCGMIFEIFASQSFSSLDFEALGSWFEQKFKIYVNTLNIHISLRGVSDETFYKKRKVRLLVLI